LWRGQSVIKGRDKQIYHRREKGETRADMVNYIGRLVKLWLV